MFRDPNPTPRVGELGLWWAQKAKAKAQKDEGVQAGRGVLQASKQGSKELRVSVHVTDKTGPPKPIW